MGYESLRADHPIALLFPGLNASQKRLGILIPHFDVFCCLTGSARLLGSRAIEDNFLVLGQGGKFGLELIKRNCSLELQLLELRFVPIRADKKGLARFQFRINLFRANAFGFWHDVPPPVFDDPLKQKITPKGVFLRFNQLIL